jgi:hypothetical protein
MNQKEIKGHDPEDRDDDIHQTLRYDPAKRLASHPNAPPRT